MALDQADVPSTFRVVRDEAMTPERLQEFNTDPERQAELEERGYVGGHWSEFESVDGSGVHLLSIGRIFDSAEGARADFLSRGLCPETFDIGTIGDASVSVVCGEGEQEVAVVGFLEGPVWVNIIWTGVGPDREATFDLLADMARTMQARAAAMSTEATNPG